MIGGILADVFGDVVFDILFGWLLPNRPSKPLPEGNWNASLGALSAFLGLTALLAAGISFVVARDTNTRPTPALVTGAAVCSLLFAYVSFRCGVRTPNVTRRNRPLAALGIVLASAAALISIAAVTLLVLQGAKS